MGMMFSNYLIDPAEKKTERDQHKSRGGCKIRRGAALEPN
jgi:hypothetical protein